jgi:hypothetical protein
MRFFEFDGAGATAVDELGAVLRLLIGQATSKKQAAKYNWAAISALYKRPLTYKTFVAILNAAPGIQDLVRQHDEDGLELNVPGAPDADKPQTNLDQSKADVNKIAAGAAATQLAQ